MRRGHSGADNRDGGVACEVLCTGFGGCTGLTASCGNPRFVLQGKSRGLTAGGGLVLMLLDPSDSLFH